MMGSLTIPCVLGLSLFYPLFFFRAFSGRVPLSSIFSLSLKSCSNLEVFPPLNPFQSPVLIRDPAEQFFQTKGFLLRDFGSSCTRTCSLPSIFFICLNSLPPGPPLQALVRLAVCFHFIVSSPWRDLKSGSCASSRPLIFFFRPSLIL